MGKHWFSQGILDEVILKRSYDVYREKLDAGECLVPLVKENYQGKISNDWTPYQGKKWSDAAKTCLTLETINRLEVALHRLPAGFVLHPAVERLMAERQKMTQGDLPMNWGYAETLAYASLLDEGYGVRLTGQDVGRGTFAHRHAVLHDYKTGKECIPLAQLVKNKEKAWQSQTHYYPKKRCLLLNMAMLARRLRPWCCGKHNLVILQMGRKW